MSNYEIIFFPSIFTRLGCGGSNSLFNLPAKPSISFEVAYDLQIDETVIVAKSSICMAGGYSAVLFKEYFTTFSQLIGKRTKH